MQIFQKVKTGGLSICVFCVHRKVCKGIDNQPCVECNQFLNEDKKPQTNADRIRAMSDEGLAQALGLFVNGNLFDLICDNPKRMTDCDSKCVKCISEWLKQTVEVE